MSEQHADDLSRRRILKRGSLPMPEDPSALAGELRSGWQRSQVVNIPLALRDREWELRHHCALTIDDDGALQYLSFAHHKLVRFPTMPEKMVSRAA